MRTPEELRAVEEKNYHGAISAIFAAPDTGPAPNVRTVIEVIERRFGMTNEVTGQLTTIEIAEMLDQQMRAALEHLRPDTVDWFRSRMNYLLDCAENRRRPE